MTRYNVGVKSPRFSGAMDPTHKHLHSPLIVIVDDDISVRRSTRRLLRTVGLRAETFASTEEFLNSGWAESSSCLILDLRMPGMNGLQLQRQLADMENPIPIIFLSAHSIPDDERQALQTGAVQFLRKPRQRPALAERSSSLA